MVTITKKIGSRELSATAATAKEAMQSLEDSGQGFSYPLGSVEAYARPTSRDDLLRAVRLTDDLIKAHVFGGESGFRLSLRGDLIGIQVPPLAEYLFKVNTSDAPVIARQLNPYLRTIEQNAIDRCAKIAEEYRDEWSKASDAKAIAAEIRKQAAH